MFQYIKFFLLLAISWSVPFLLIPNIKGLMIEIQFFIVTIVVILLGYYFQWVNKDRIESTGEIEHLLEKKRKDDFSKIETNNGNETKLIAYVSHLVLFFSALIISYGVVTHNNIVILLGVIPWWYFDDIMLKKWIEKLTRP